MCFFTGECWLRLLRVLMDLYCWGVCKEINKDGRRITLRRHEKRVLSSNVYVNYGQLLSHKSRGSFEIRAADWVVRICACEKDHKYGIHRNPILLIASCLKSCFSIEIDIKHSLGLMARYGFAGIFYCWVALPNAGFHSRYLLGNDRPHHTISCVAEFWRVCIMFRRPIVLQIASTQY